MKLICEGGYIIKIAIYPWNNKLLNDNLFLSNKDSKGVEQNYFCILRESLNLNNKTVRTVDMFKDYNYIDCILFFDMPSKRNLYFKLYKKFRGKIFGVLLLWEPPVVYKKNYLKSNQSSFDYLITWNDDLIDDKKFFKFNYPQPQTINQLYNIDFKDKNFCTMISSNKRSFNMMELYTERLRIINYFESKDLDFNFYGFGWLDKPVFLGGNCIQKLVSKAIKKFNSRSKQNYKNYQGAVKNKHEVMSRYKFTICFENQGNLNGYVSEKIFDCLLSGTVPIYFGAKNIQDIIPFKCYIDFRDFETLDQLVNYLINVTELDYKVFLSEAEAFLSSKYYNDFTYLEQIKLLDKYLDKFQTEFRGIK